MSVIGPVKRLWRLWLILFLLLSRYNNYREQNVRDLPILNQATTVSVLGREFTTADSN